MAANLKLAEKQGLTEEEVVEIGILHVKLDSVTRNPYDHDDPVKLIEEIEFNLQRLWKFPQDKNFHRYWYAISGCTCPKSDNNERVGTKYKVINNGCKWHGKEKKSIGSV
jgi:hypothetical protein